MTLTEPDKGWAWIILVASFVEHCIAGFSLYSIGLFHIIFLDRFREDITLTSWISAVFLCLLSLTGKKINYQ